MNLGISAYNNSNNNSNETGSSFSRYSPPPPYDLKMPAISIPVQHLQRCRHYEEPPDPYAASYHATIPLLRMSPAGRTSNYHYEVYHQQTPSDPYEIQPVIERGRSF